MKFKIKASPLVNRGKFHRKYLTDNSRVLFTLHYVGDGVYLAKQKDRIVNHHISYTEILDKIVKSNRERPLWKIFNSIEEYEQYKRTETN